jgi:acyl-coA thioesterase I-like protein
VTIWKTGEVEMIHKPGVGHHPHSLENPAPIVAFLEKHCLPSRG